MLSIILHGFFFVMTTTQTPYFSPLSNAIAIAAAFANLANPVLLLCMYYGAFTDLPADVTPARASTHASGPLVWLAGCRRRRCRRRCCCH